MTKPPTRLFHRLTNWIVDVPAATVVLIVLVTAISCAGHYAPERILEFFNPPVEQPREERRGRTNDDDERPPDVEAFSLTDSHAVVVAESDDFFTPSGAKALRRVVDQLESLPHVRSVVWMDRVPILNIFGLPEPLLPRETASQTRFDNARQKAIQHPLVMGQLLSADGRTLLLLVNFDFFYVETDEDCIEGLSRTAEAAIADIPDVAIDFSVTGRVPMRLTAWKAHDANLLKYQLIGYGMIAIMSLILFRGISAVIIVAVAPALGVFWTMGMLPYFDLQENPFNDVILPVLISLVGLTDGVHLMVHIRKLRAAGLATREAARQGVHEVGLACALTSLTTAIGFGSLSLASHETVREFGMCCVLGVLLTFISVVTTIPLLTSSWLGRNVHKGLEKSLIDKNLTRIGSVVDFVLHRTLLFSLLGIGTTVVLGAVCLALRPDERRTEGLPTNAEPVLALQKMDRALGGLEFGEVGIHWSRKVKPNAREILEVVRKADDVLRQEALIGHPLSIRNLVDALPGDRNAVDRMSMLELLPPPLKRAFYAPENRYAKVIFRVQDVGIAKYGPVFERLQQELEQVDQQHPEFSVYLQESGAVWRWRNLFQIVEDLLNSLGWASFIIFGVLTIAYRSLRIGLISIIPNLFPLVLSASFLVVTGQYLEMVSVCAFTICLGIAVDDTIHFLTRYTEERKRTDDEHEAIRRAFTGVGTALIMTTVVLLAGFCTVVLSESREHRIFAWMGGITIASALFGDLIFLPALLARFAGKPKRDEGSAQPEVMSTADERKDRSMNN